MFTNQHLVYEALSAPMRELLDGCTAVHTAAVFGHPEQMAEHPVVRRHPVTGRRSLYVNRQFTSHIPQLRRSESDAVLADLYAFSEQPQFQCRYRWERNTLALWDNRVVQHCAIPDYRERRVMYRTMIAGTRPHGPLRAESRPAVVSSPTGRD